MTTKLERKLIDENATLKNLIGRQKIQLDSRRREVESLTKCNELMRVRINKLQNEAKR